MATVGLTALSPLHADPAAIPLSEALQKKQGLTGKLTGDGAYRLDLSIENSAATPARVEIPAGFICKTAAGNRVIVLRGTQLEIAAHGASDAQIPTAALASTNAVEKAAPFAPVADAEPKLAPLLKYLSTRTDVPRETSQLITFAILEDITFAKWQQFLAARPADQTTPAQAQPSLAEITQAIDALGVLREIAPDRAFALASDPELKLRALRNPICRAKALQLYGMTIPGDTAAGGVPPDLGQLLHTKPGDNCPICRMRAQMQGPASDL